MHPAQRRSTPPDDSSPTWWSAAWPGRWGTISGRQWLCRLAVRAL